MKIDINSKKAFYKNKNKKGKNYLKSVIGTNG